MAIVYKNGRLVRTESAPPTTMVPPSGGNLTPEQVAAIIGYGEQKKLPSGGANQPVLPALTPEQAKARATFDANYVNENKAREIAKDKGEKERTAFGKKDADGDGIPNSIDKDNNTPKVIKGTNTNMANTPVNTYINNQLRNAGLPNTPANRAKLRTEYIKIEADKADVLDKETKATAKETAKTAKETADNQAAYNAIINSIGGYETRAGTVKTDAMQRLADLYDPQISVLGTQKQDQLNLLQRVLGQAGTDIDASEKDFLSRLITPSAYTDVPLLDIPQEQNALMAALQSQGADTGQVAAQSAADASVNTFMKQLLSRSNQQYGNAQTNYVDALRNAGMGAAKSGRDYLALENPRLQSGINSKFADALANLNTNRTNAEGDIMDTFQKALESAAEIKAKGETDYPLATRPAATPVVTPMDTPAVDALTPLPVDNFEQEIETRFTGRPEQGGSGFGGLAPTLAPTSDATDFSNMTEEDKKKLQEFLANVGSFGMGFLTR